jgi:hypothetical protein
MRRVRTLGAVVALAVGLGVVVPTTGDGAAAAGKGEFAALCPLSHRLTDDPLVHPGMPGMSHRHDFFGNRTTNASSTVTSLRAGTTTCDPLADRSAYWVPTLYVGSRALAPAKVTIYYSAEAADPTKIMPFPLGLSMIVGNARAIGPTAGRAYDWSCRGTVGNQATIPACPAGSELELLIHFPDCWNGRDLDSVDHTRHVAFSAAHHCPAGYPVAFPRLEYKIVYATPPGVTATLASGNGYTAHADFVNAWTSSALRRRVDACLHALVKCGPAGTPI